MAMVSLFNKLLLVRFYIGTWYMVTVYSFIGANLGL